jgi:hypothetical protein
VQLGSEKPSILPFADFCRLGFLSFFYALERINQTVIMREAKMDFGRGLLLWLLGVPLPIILLLALFWHH